VRKVSEYSHNLNTWYTTGTRKQRLIRTLLTTGGILEKGASAGMLLGQWAGMGNSIKIFLRLTQKLLFIFFSAD